MTEKAKPPIVLIHGLWMTPASWDTWARRFRALGHKVIAPGWPGVDDRTPAQVRRDPSGLKGVGMKELLDHYERIVSDLATKPIIMGHSFGGLVTLLLADRDLGAAYVGVEPGPPAGTLVVPPAMIRTGLPILSNPFALNGAQPISKQHFHFTFGNDLTRAQSDAEWEQSAVPAANRVMFDGVLNLPRGRGAVTYVDYAKPDRAPLLLIGGEKDHTVPAATVRAIAKKYQRSGSQSVVEHREYPDRTHRIISQQGWEEIADDTLDWATTHGRA